jgi:hypothetical protein
MRTTASTKKKLIGTFSLFGLLVAIILGGARLYMLHHEPLYRDVLYGGRFDTITLILWPSSFLSGGHGGEGTRKVAFAVWSIAVLSNPPIYALLG